MRRLLAPTYDFGLIVVFEAMSREALEAAVREHADTFQLGGEVTRSRMDMLALNMLRHTGTNYDLDQSLARMLAAHEAIVAVYPHLAEEAERQNAQRAQREAIFGSRRTWHTPGQTTTFRANREVRSRNTVERAQIYVGQEVEVSRFGQEYPGVISWVGKTRVGVTFTDPSGATFTDTVPAANVTPS